MLKKSLFIIYSFKKKIIIYCHEKNQFCAFAPIHMIQQIENQNPNKINSQLHHHDLDFSYSY